MLGGAFATFLLYRPSYTDPWIESLPATFLHPLVAFIRGLLLFEEATSKAHRILASTLRRDIRLMGGNKLENSSLTSSSSRTMECLPRLLDSKDRIRPVFRRSKPSSRTLLCDEHSHPRWPLHHQDRM